MIVDQPAQQPAPANPDNPMGTPSPTPNPDQPNAALNPTVVLTRTDTDNLEEYVRKHSDIGLDWYVPNLCNTHVRETNSYQCWRNKDTLQLSPVKRFTTPCFELNLTTGQVYTYLMPAEDIGVPCQQEEFNLDLLRERLQNHTEPMDHGTQDLKRIPLIRKTAPVADIMDMMEIEEKLGQYCQLWELYADASCELARKSRLSPEEAARACKVYEPYIHDILQKVNAAITLFVMEKELRHLKGRGYFPVPIIRPHHKRIENTQQVRKIMESVDEELVQVLTTVRKSEKTYEKRRRKPELENNKQEHQDSHQGRNTTSSV